MAYPSLPTTYLNPPTVSVSSSDSASASSVEPLTPPSAQGVSPFTPSARSDGEDERATTQAGAANAASAAEPGIECKWKDCSYTAPGPEDLYTHLCETHIGRKSTNNLCLTCAWEGCGVKCVKRDHITSHLRVHTPLKPHPCSVCGKTFKRPQDLKKHERIHTTEHHQLHKLSKATTTTDPEFNSRFPSREDRPLAAAFADRSPAYSLSPRSSPHNPTSPYENANLLGLPTHANGTPSPSALAALHKKQHEELAAYQQRELLALQQLAFQQQQSSAYAAQLAAEALGSKGLKRSSDDAFDSFVEDMKKRKMDPVYDIDMISRLNSLMPPGLPAGFPNSGMNGFPGGSLPFSYPSLNGLGGMGSGAPPMPIPDIRSEADLAMFNQFMVSLGREATHASAAPMETSSSSNTSASASRNSLSPPSDASPIEDLFNPSELVSLGLAGMPGIPNSGSGASIPGNGASGVSLGSLYPSLDGLNSEGRPRAASVSEAVESAVRRPIAALPRAGSTSGASSRSTFANGAYAGLSQYSQLPSDWLTSNGGEQNFASFDTLARARNSVPAATLAPRDFYKRTYRHIAPLGAAPRESAERTGADEEDELTESEEGTPEPQPRIPVNSLLVEGDPTLKLPALGEGAGDGKGISLPPLRLAAPVTTPRRTLSPARHPPVKRHTDEQLIHGVKRLELEDRKRGDSPAESTSTASTTPSRHGSAREERDPVAEMRRRHAALIRAWLLAVNLEFKRRQLQGTMADTPRRVELAKPCVEIAA